MQLVEEKVVRGHRALVIANEAISLVMLPSLGGRIWECWDICRARQWIWHRSDVTLIPQPPGAAYDSRWAGGWEELFPNDSPIGASGEAQFDHGEWWTASWIDEVLRDRETPRLRLTATLPVSGVSCIKEIGLRPHAAVATIDYTIRNLRSTGLHFLFKQHLPISLEDGCRIALPGGQVSAVTPGFGTLVRGEGEFTWPIVNGEDLSKVREPSSRAREFVYVSALPAPWCGVDDPYRRASLRLHFDTQVVPHVWLFLTYGGWQDCHTVVLEPCTNRPKDLPDAVARGQCAYLPPHGVFHTTFSLSLGDCA